jgi:hypothetical protein
MTIFSIVKAEKLSSLFEMVAEALRDNRVRIEQDESTTDDTQSSGDTTGDSGKSGSDKGQWEYAAMTLPCISFPSRKTPGTSHHPNPLYMTMALMSDEDPRRRCFHCILTDDPGTNETMGFITPELMALLFSPEKRISPILKQPEHLEPASSSSSGSTATSVSESNTKTSDSYSEDLAETVASDE